MGAFSDHQDITYNVTGQSLVLDVPEGRPSSVTSVSVFTWDSGDDSTAESATTGSASIDSVSTVVDADSGRAQPNPRKLNLNSTSNISVDEAYLVTGGNGEKEWAVPVEIATDDYIICRYPLAHDYVTGNAFEGTRISISVDSTWVADDGNISDATETAPGYRVRWVYVVDGVTHVRYTTFDLVRYAGVHNVSPFDVDRIIPGWIAALPRAYKDDNGRALIDTAHEQVVIDLLQEGINDEQARYQMIVDELTKRMAVLLWAESRAMMSGGSLEAVEIARTAYQQRLNQFVRGPSRIKIPISTDTTGAGARKAPSAITVR